MKKKVPAKPQGKKKVSTKTARTRADERVVKNLEKINAKMEKQTQLGHMLYAGVIHGIGIVAGSTIFAVVIISVVVQIFGDLPIVGDFIKYIQANQTNGH
jgi:hypothetical protein